MKCNACNTHFSERDAMNLMKSASFAGGTLKCPRCGHEISEMPDIAKLFKKWGKRKSGVSR